MCVFLLCPLVSPSLCVIDVVLTWSECSRSRGLLLCFTPQGQSAACVVYKTRGLVLMDTVVPSNDFIFLYDSIHHDSHQARSPEGHLHAQR